MSKLRVSLAEAMGRAHRVLLEELRDLEKAVGPPLPGGPARLIPRLEWLREHLAEHFRFEEENGYLVEVRQREPNREREINQLQEEHRQLAQSLNALLGEARGASNRSDSFGEKVRAWVEQVRRHESHENRLVQDAFNRDTSAED